MRLLLALALALGACDSPAPETDAGSEDAAMDEDASTATCERDLDCDDGTFCNGAERCEPGASGADARGCVPGGDPGCLEGQDCDVEMDRCVSDCDANADADGDGRDAIECGGDDCDDSDRLRFPGATEICDPDNRDEDCNPATFGFRDADGDGEPDAMCCNGETCGSDCDDMRPGVNPTVPEVCGNGLDDDCDGFMDEGVTVTCWADPDGDGYAAAGAASSTECACAPGTTARMPADLATTDCAEDLVTSFPGAAELCNDGDDDCDGSTDEGLAQVTVYFDLDGDLRAGDPQIRCAGFPGSEPSSTDCNETATNVYVGAPETCDRVDNDCSSGGGADSSEDADGDDFAPIGASCTGGFPASDCDDSDPGDFPGADEVCGRGDNDCDGSVDEEPIATASCDADSATMACVAGSCGVITCDQDTADCDGVSGNGCEQELLNDPMNCGGCGVECGVAGTCEAGVCSPVIDVVDGAAHSCVLRDNGRVACWGSNEVGQLGPAAVGMLASRVPVEITGLPPVIDITAGTGHTCVTAEDATLWCWGHNLSGVILGPGSPSPQSAAPVQILTSVGGPPLENVNGISAGSAHTCVRQSVGFNNRVLCWGSNNRGQLGDGTTVSRATPEIVLGVSTAELTSVSRVRAGWGHSCAVTFGPPRIVCWGGNDEGQLGDGTQTDRSRPVLVSGLTSPSRVELGFKHSCGLTSGGDVSCWGRNEGGELGDSGASGSRSTVPVPVAGLGLTERIQVGGDSSCAADEYAAYRCWGAGIGDSPVDQDMETDVANTEGLLPRDRSSGAGGFVEVGIHRCVLRRTGQVTCTGENRDGQLGDGTTTDRSDWVIVQGLGRFVEASAGGATSCARRDSGEASCWGFWELGLGTYDGYFFHTRDRRRPEGVTNYVAARTIATRGAFTCTVSSSGIGHCWGSTFAVGAPNGAVPTQISGFTQLATSATVGLHHACFVHTDGSVTCFGDNAEGQIGDGTSGNIRTEPTLVASFGDAVEVAAGRAHTCGRTRTGEVYCWGDDSLGQLGNDAALSDSQVPVQVAEIAAAVELAAGLDHTCARLVTGEVRCWGSALDGRLGNNSTTPNQPTPVTVVGTTTTLSDLVEIYAGDAHTCGVRADGEHFCWGDNQSGQLGLGNTSNRSTPSAIPIFRGRHGDGGELHSCAVEDDGSVACWGRNHRAQLGDGTISQRTSPTPVQLTP